jgi:hypothetical protein
MPKPKPLRPLDETTLKRMIRYALETGGTTLQLRPGRRPLLRGLGAPRELRFRQLSVDDTRAAAACFLAKSPVPRRLADSRAEGASPFYLAWELPGEALVEPRLASAERGGLVLHLDVIPPLPAGTQIEVLES